MKFTFAAALAAFVAPVAGQEVIALHGSGTTNPSRCFWHIMDLMQTRIKVPVKMTYRGVGSSTGQAEFIGDVSAPDNDFGSGDIPITADDYARLPANSILHLPILLGAISFFHSAPTGGQQLNLTPCVLAKILKRDITDWSDAEVADLNPGLNLASMPITVARRVLGSSSTASITEYLRSACPAVWPENLVGGTIDWPADTEECEGSGGMTNCIRDIPGTIGYIESGHGIAEGLQEIELRNADGVYLSSSEAASRGGIMAAAENAAFPDSLDGNFADVTFLNQPGPNTWPIVAMSYIYVRKDLTHIENPASQTLLKAFLRSLYADDYVPLCEEEFGFFRVTGDIREKALAAIDALETTPGAPEWIFEQDTQVRTGQRDYVISAKRDSYSEIQQQAAISAIATLTEELNQLRAQVANLNMQAGQAGSDHSHSHEDTQGIAQFINAEADEDTQVKVALALGSISFIFWMLAIIFAIVKFIVKV